MAANNSCTPDENRFVFNGPNAQQKDISSFTRNREEDIEVHIFSMVSIFLFVAQKKCTSCHAKIGSNVIYCRKSQR